MRFQQVLDQYPRIQIADPARQEHIFSIIDQTSLSANSLQVSFERKPNFYHFLKAQGDHEFVFNFVNKDGTPEGFAACTFRHMKWQGQPTCLGYFSDLRTTPKLDRDARVQWRKCYSHVINASHQIDEFQGCIGFVTAVWNENKLAQKALVKKDSTKKSRPDDFNYQLAHTYRSDSVWGRWKPLRKTNSLVRPILRSEIDSLIKAFCEQKNLSWNEDDLSRTLAVFQKSYKDFFVLEENDAAKAYVLPTSISSAKRTLIKKWPYYLSLAAKLLPLFGKKPVRLCEPFEITQLSLFKSLSGDETDNLHAFIDYFWQQNSRSPKDQQFSALTVNTWAKAGQKPLDLKKRGYLFTSIEGALYKVTSKNTSPHFSEINDFTNLDIGFL